MKALRGIAHPISQYQHRYPLPEFYSSQILDTNGQLLSVRVAQRRGVNAEINVDRSRQTVLSLRSM